MLGRPTVRLTVLIVIGYALLWLPALLWDRYLDSPVGLIAAFPVISVYLFHKLGVPGLLEHGGACGWGWCAPTAFGWVFIVLVWFGLAVAIARLVVAVGRKA